MPYYHVIVSLKGRPQEDALAMDLSEKKLMDRILKPRLEGRKFACNLELVDPDDVKSIKITKTDKPILEIIGGSFVPTYIQYWEAANSGEDVTDYFIPKTEAKIKETSVKHLSKDIFIVHGREHKPMKELKVMLKGFGLNPIVLHEQPSGSRTIVEKLEKYSDAGYAFVILTPDDRGGYFRGKSRILGGNILEDSHFRARQNAILELGYFMGLLGRDRVCCLYKGDLDLPSDIHGIVYISFKESVNEAGDKIVKELKAAGYEIKA